MANPAGFRKYVNVPTKMRNVLGIGAFVIAVVAVGQAVGFLPWVTDKAFQARAWVMIPVRNFFSRFMVVDLDELEDE